MNRDVLRRLHLLIGNADKLEDARKGLRVLFYAGLKNGAFSSAGAGRFRGVSRG